MSFYRAPVTLLDSSFEDSRSEDALNVTSSDVVLERVGFDGGASDLFDGDFVTGSIRDCEFQNSDGDAIDVSGSHLKISTCRMRDIGDKAISAGEGSVLNVEACVVAGASIAVAAKVSSKVHLIDLQARRIGHYLLAAYIKKSEYGPASIESTGLRHLDTEDIPNLVQLGCHVVLEGVELPAAAVDVADLYRRKILGK